MAEEHAIVTALLRITPKPRNGSYTAPMASLMSAADMAPAQASQMSLLDPKWTCNLSVVAHDSFRLHGHVVLFRQVGFLFQTQMDLQALCHLYRQKQAHAVHFCTQVMLESKL